MKTIFDQTEHIKTVYEESANKVTLTTQQDAQPILDRNAYERNNKVNANANGPFGRKVASIPLVLWNQWVKETNGRIQFDREVQAKYLNNPDFAKFRTHNSVV